MRDHVKILGILNIVFGAIGLLIGCALLALFGGLGVFATVADGGSNPDAALAIPVLGAVGGVLFAILAVFSAPGLIAGWGLLQMKSWARILTIVLSALNLLNVPIGTALGAYGLWVCLSEETVRLFEAEQRAAAPYSAGPASS